MWFCSNCGNRLKEDENFCANCGNKATRETENTYGNTTISLGKDFSNQNHDRGFIHLTKYYQEEYSMEFLLNTLI